MRARFPHTTLFPLLLLGLGCGRRTMGPAGGSGEGGSGVSAAATDTATSTASESEDTAGSSAGGAIPPPPDCGEGFTACLVELPKTYDEDYAWECTWLNSSPTHCGECGHRCEGLDINHCTGGQCDPGLQPCIEVDPSLANCTEACASVGETCRDDATCSGTVVGYMGGGGYDPVEVLDKCTRLAEASFSAGFDLACDDPIPWGHEDIDGRTLVGILCCCTQD
ncbi:hypothetical protein [Paraliomyxa miuraensis]|uniref:hypothetical protein n=1 Tax=Paraliomyxa miuraensis TaxID=376150 RepID=UPI002258E50A|nr:hypothetical protein [Paraliomyxa miuraensis]MCX4246705.1 hypothetical protein [Paraliomyxa miuraensis]